MKNKKSTTSERISPHYGEQFEARAGAIIHGVVIELLKWLFAWDGKKSNLPRNLARFSGGVLHTA